MWVCRISKAILVPVRRRFADKTVRFYFENKNKSLTAVEAKVGENVLEIAHQYDIDLEGACDMQLACSTCHVILEQHIFDGLEPPEPREEDMLDMAPGLTRTSRLGCQVKVTEDFQGAKVKLPDSTRNFYVDGFQPKPH
jgi:ferredoxin